MVQKTKAADPKASKKTTSKAKAKPQAQTEAGKETLQFETEVSQLLKLMIHSLYSNQEIFLRELISNASDACDKLRFSAVKNDALYEGDSNLQIRIAFDETAKTVTISDNGVGMNRDEVIANIGTIAKSGTKQFLETLSGDNAKDAKLIGQFGVGFYSAFIVADKVTLSSRRAGDAANTAVTWESDGTGSYSLENTTREKHGTEVVLHLKKDAEEFANGWRLRSIVKKYSDHITFPVVMDAVQNEEDQKAGKDIEEETVNTASALWTRAKKDIKNEEYNEFYKHVSHDFEDPLAWSHNRVEGKLEYTTLLYIPKRAPFDLWQNDTQHGLKLFVQRVFIMDDAEKLMPRYLRFVRGLVDSNDLPLNVSREILQSNKIIDSIRAGSVKKVLDLLEKLSKDKAEDYQKFWDEFGNALKEGPAEDVGNKEQIAKLFRFSTTNTDSKEQTVSLDEYITRLKPGQEKIYYVTADSFQAAKNSPHIEQLRDKGIEVLLMHDRIDEWMMSYLQEYAGKQFLSAAKGELDLPEGDADKKDEDKTENKAESELAERIQKSLSEKVEAVKISTRLKKSPACLVLKEHEMAMHMQQLMKQAGHAMPDSKPTLEINPDHQLLIRMVGETDEAKFADWANILLDQAILAEGGQLEDPASFVSKLNEMMFSG